MDFTRWANNRNVGGEAQQERIYNVLNVQLYKMYKTFLSCFHVTMNTAYKFIFFKVVFFFLV